MSKKCIFGLYEYCIVLNNLGCERKEWGTKEWVRIYCSMCIKTVYAKAKIEKITTSVTV